jgi:hypothetical protein
MPVPPLCERCWFPVRPDEPVRRLVGREGGETVLRGYEHAEGTCTAQEPATGDDAA